MASVEATSAEPLEASAEDVASVELPVASAEDVGSVVAADMALAVAEATAVEAIGETALIVNQAGPQLRTGLFRFLQSGSDSSQSR